MKTKSGKTTKRTAKKQVKEKGVKKRGQKRKRSRYPGLDPSVNGKKRWEYIDFDYIDKLSDKEKEWLSNFNEEYLSGNMNHPGKKFHKTKKERKECYDRNNARNRCILSEAKALGRVAEFDVDVIDKRQKDATHHAEDIIIEKIDAKDEKPEE